MLENSTPENRARGFVKRSVLEARPALYYAPEDIKALLHYEQHTLEALADAVKLCRIVPRSPKGCVLSLLGILYNGLPVKPLSKQTLKRVLGRGA